MGPIRWWSSNKKIFKQFNWKVFWAANFESIEIELAGRGGGSSQTSNYFLIDRIDAALRCPAIYHFLGARVVQLTKLSKEVNQWIPHSLDSLYSQGHQHLVREVLLNAQGPEKEGWGEWRETCPGGRP